VTSAALQLLADQLEKSTAECRRLAEENDRLWWAYELGQGNPYGHLTDNVPHPLVAGLLQTSGDARWSQEVREVSGLLAGPARARVDAGLSIWCEAEPSQDGPGRRRIASPRPVVPRKLRTAVHERDAYRCVACGSHLRLRIDHIVPYSTGGPSVEANLQTLCEPHNMAQGIKIPAEWAPLLERIRAEAGLPFGRADCDRLVAALATWTSSVPTVRAS
jgi:5-methylcytosine-specific restriction endonuclease McrA